MRERRPQGAATTAPRFDQRRGNVPVMAMIRMRPRSSLSFLLVLLVPIAGGGVYGLWSYLRPDPAEFSEHLVREFARAAGEELGVFRRELRTLLAEGAKGGADGVAALLAAIDERAAKATARIKARADEARERVPVNLRASTQGNRLMRIDAREKEAREMVSWVAEDAKEKLRNRH